MDLNDYIYSTYEVYPDKGIQNTRIYISRICNIHEYKSFYNKKKYKHIKKTSYIAGAGTSERSNSAAFLSKMEALERLANSLPVADTIIETAENLGEQAIDLALFPRLASYEISFNRNFKTNELIRWVRSINITTKEIKYIPQIYINLFTNKEFQGESIANPTSTGAAIHNNYAQAIINGIYEVIERDGIALSWLLKIPMKRFNIEGHENELIVFANNFLGEIELHNASTIKGIYTFCLRAKLNHAKKIKNVLAYSSHVNPSVALKKVKNEIILILNSLSNESKVNPDVINKDYKNFSDLFEGALYMCHPKNDHEFDFLNHTEEIPFPKDTNNFIDSISELRFLIGCLKEQGHEIYVTDLTNRECIENNLNAVKVTIPSLQPISFIYKSRFLNSDRIREFSRSVYGSYNDSMINHKPFPFF
jgi:ribosomal protein S12 methylthiotransferase accessory factor